MGCGGSKKTAKEPEQKAKSEEVVEEIKEEKVESIHYETEEQAANENENLFEEENVEGIVYIYIYIYIIGERAEAAEVPIMSGYDPSPDKEEKDRVSERMEDDQTLSERSNKPSSGREKVESAGEDNMDRLRIEEDTYFPKEEYPPSPRTREYELFVYINKVRKDPLLLLPEMLEEYNSPSDLSPIYKECVYQGLRFLQGKSPTTISTIQSIPNNSDTLETALDPPTAPPLIWNHFLHELAIKHTENIGGSGECSQGIITHGKYHVLGQPLQSIFVIHDYTLKNILITIIIDYFIVSRANRRGLFNPTFTKAALSIYPNHGDKLQSNTRNLDNLPTLIVIFYAQDLITAKAYQNSTLIKDTFRDSQIWVPLGTIRVIDQIVEEEEEGRYLNRYIKQTLHNQNGSIHKMEVVQKKDIYSYAEAQIEIVDQVQLREKSPVVKDNPDYFPPLQDRIYNIYIYIYI